MQDMVIGTLFYSAFCFSACLSSLRLVQRAVMGEAFRRGADDFPTGEATQTYHSRVITTRHLCLLSFGRRQGSPCSQFPGDGLGTRNSFIRYVCLVPFSAFACSHVPPTVFVCVPTVFSKGVCLPRVVIIPIDRNMNGLRVGVRAGSGKDTCFCRFYVHVTRAPVSSIGCQPVV